MKIIFANCIFTFIYNTSCTDTQGGIMDVKGALKRILNPYNSISVDPHCFLDLNHPK